MLQWLVELKSPQQIKELVKEHFNKDLHRSSVWRYAHSKKWRPILERLKARFERSISKIPIANKSHRIRILQKVVDEGLTWSLKNITKDGDEVYELKLGAVTEAVKAAREELEPRRVELSGHLTSSLYPEFEKKSNDTIRKEIEEMGRNILEARQGIAVSSKN